MEDSLNCFGALALEVSPSATAEDAPVQFPGGRDSLGQAATEPLIEQVLIDLQRLLPEALELDLGLAFAAFDPAELLRPGWPVHAALADLLVGAPGERSAARVVGLWASAGRMPARALQPDPTLLGGPLRLLPFVLHGRPDRIAAVGRRMEDELMEKGMAGAATALALQKAFELPLEHVRYLSLHDLCAMTALQYEHAGLAPVWSLLEAALFTPQGREVVNVEQEPPALFAEGQVRIALQRPAGLEAEAAALGLPAAAVARMRQMRARQWQAVLAAHGVAAELVEIEGTDVLAELDAAMRRH
ncbi:MAG: hypothetical protein MEQ07_05380 [Aquimonas sp.]|nr:hypothetical protein [Aquimonas sp.]